MRRRLPFLLIPAVIVVGFIALNFPLEDPAPSLTKGRAACDNCIKNLQGKLVYQRPHGVYWHRLGETKSKLIYREGRWPRWSPDGKQVAFVYKNKIMLKNLKGGPAKVVATATKARSLAFFPNAKRLAFTDDKFVKAVDLKTGRISVLAKGEKFREIDISANGQRLAATVKGFGFSIRIFELDGGDQYKLASGCSANFSPDGKMVSNLIDSHKTLLLLDGKSAVERGRISAPKGLKFDNQSWSNHPDWLVSISEGKKQIVYVHHIPSDGSWVIGVDTDSDRPDLFVEY